MGVYYNEADVDSNGAEEVNLRTSAGVELLGQQTSAASVPVVLASNQSTLPVGQVDATGTGTLTAAAQTIVANTNGASTVTWQMSGIFSLTYTFEGSCDGTNWIQNGYQGLTGGIGEVTIPCGAYKQVRIRCTAYTSGTLSAIWYASLGVHVVMPVLPTGSALPVSASALPLPSGASTSALQTTGNTSLGNIDTKVSTAANQATEIASLASIDAGIPAALGQTTMSASMPVVLASDQSSVPVKLSDTAKLVYRCVVGPFTPPATPTDMFTITGSATKTVRVISIDFSAVETTQGTNTIFIVKRSAANTGGTSTTPTVVPTDSNDAAATAVVRQYTANPTGLGAAVGNVSIQRVFTSVPGATAVGGAGCYFDFYRDGAEKGIVLRGVAQTLAVNFNGAALPVGFSVTGVVAWVEE